ncbi:MAG: AAA family ATPase [Candidatus Alcyoniella australis]|nr:AAA family ATPase [Candidatus Alcyoniella australis]
MPDPEDFTVSLQTIRRLLVAGYPLLQVLSWEEERVVRHLTQLAQSGLTSQRKIGIWSVTQGWQGQMEDRNVHEITEALTNTIEAQGDWLFIFKDVHPYLMGDPLVIRRVRDTINAVRGTDKSVILLGPIISIPEELQKDVSVVDYDLPGVNEIEPVLLRAVEECAIKHGKLVSMPMGPDRELFFRALLGLTEWEIENVARKIIIETGTFGFTSIDYILEEKRQILRKTEILEFHPPAFSMEQVGGLERFKEWCEIRREGFSEGAQKFGLPRPKGILITGISGCGKSLAIQAVAHQWQMPLLRLDMGRVFAGFAGSPEESMRRAIKTVEAVAPAILWIDEIEMGVSVFSDSVESGSTSRIFASFLTWMQEKTAPVFIAATANDIDRLPPEFIRKGRFDEVFFVDLPNYNERKDIFRIHMESRGKEASETSYEGLARHSEGYSGAEIEQAIVSALYRAYHEHRALVIQDIYVALRRTVPLSVTMKEQITNVKRWAEKRAVKAS